MPKRLSAAAVFATLLGAGLGTEGGARAADPAPVVAVPAPAPTRERHGPALSFGIGNIFGGVGLQARYDVPIRRWLVVSPFVAAGPIAGITHPVLGAAAALGARHRLVGELAVGPLRIDGIVLHGVQVFGGPIYGPIAGIGYEHMSDGGAFQRVTIGYVHEMWGSNVPIPDPGRMVLAFGFGWRIW